MSFIFFRDGLKIKEYIFLLAAITIGAGAQWNEVYEAVHSHGRVVVGGVSVGGSVGAAGGWLLGGGHSALSPSYGLGKSIGF